MNGKSIKVKIFGSESPLRGDSEDFTKLVAIHVDEMINSIHEKIPDQPPLTIAVLSALNITEDLLKEKDRSSSLVSYAEGEVRKISHYLDNCLRTEV